MRRTCVAVALLCIALLALPNRAKASTKTKPTLFVFGDSLTDNGNVYRATNGTIPPKSAYWDGHFSNGPVWSEYIQNLTSVDVVNYAYGASTACRLDPNATTLLKASMPILSEQVQLALNGLGSKASDGTSSRVAFIWSGHNDFLGALTLLRGKELMTALGTLGDISDCVEAAADELLKSGAFTQLVIGNIKALHQEPMTLSLASGLAGILLRTTVEGIVGLINGGLEDAVDSLRKKYPQATIKLWDSNDDMEAFIEKAPKHNFTNTTGACIEAGSAFNVSLVPSRICSNPANYVFWDNVHYTTRTNEYIAGMVLDVLKKMPAFKTHRRRHRRHRHHLRRFS